MSNKDRGGSVKDVELYLNDIRTLITHYKYVMLLILCALAECKRALAVILWCTLGLRM